jgi:hypothetical protein
MTTTNQVRKDSSAAPSARQVKTPPEKSVTVIFYSAEDDKEMFRADIPEPIFAAVRRACKKLHIGLERFFQLAVQSRIEHELAGVAAKGK